MLKQGQHARIVKITNTLDMQVFYDREVGRYQISPDDLERLVMLAAMSGNPFEVGSEAPKSTPKPSIRERLARELLD